LVDPAALGELSLCEAVRLTKIDDLQRDVVDLLEDFPLRRRVRREPGTAVGHDVPVTTCHQDAPFADNMGSYP
jgi:hypothetical protein